jgi:hypothetical protein
MIAFSKFRNQLQQCSRSAAGGIWDGCCVRLIFDARAALTRRDSGDCARMSTEPRVPGPQQLADGKPGVTEVTIALLTIEI